MIENTGRGFAAALVMALIVASSATGCGSGGGGGSDPFVDPVIGTTSPVASFVESGTAPTTDLVRTSGGSSDDLVTVEVVIAGPTTSGDLYSFAFDLVLGDPTVAEYVVGSASMGSALTSSGSQTLQVLATQQGNRVTVGATKLGGGSGNAVAGPGETAVVSVVFRVLRTGTTTLTLTGSPGAAPAALDSTGTAIPSVTFDALSATLIGI